MQSPFFLTCDYEPVIDINDYDRSLRNTPASEDLDQMRITRLIGCAAVSMLALSGIARADVIVDGMLDSAYGIAKSTVTYSAVAPESNFGSPTPFTDAIGYNIYLKAQSGYVYGFLQSHGPGMAVAPFANLYFDLDPANGNGSDLGFELGGNHLGYANAFVPGMPGSVQLTNVTTALSADQSSIEFAIPFVDFTQPISGLNYYAGQEFPGAGDPVTLRLSQSFGYSVAGGALYGTDRLGTVTLGLSAVPLPASLPMFGSALLVVAALGYGAKRKAAAAPTA